MKRIQWMVFLSLGCGVQLADEKNNTDSGVEEDTDPVVENLSDCPDVVPEQYRYVWDCQNANCNGSMVYRYGVGSTSSDQSISIEEKWFIFEGGGNYVIDTFQLEGELSEINESTFGLANLEENYEIWWEMSEQQSNWNWSKTFAEQENEEQRYYGYILIDTHTTLTQERNPENAVMVSAAPVNQTPDGAFYDLINDYARGTATPLEEEGEEYQWVPSDFVWASSGSCYE